eukprot:2538464-Rhodomonas_salina.1
MRERRLCGCSALCTRRGARARCSTCEEEMAWAERRRAMEAGEGRERLEQAVDCKAAEEVAQLEGMHEPRWNGVRWNLNSEKATRSVPQALFSDRGCGQLRRRSGEGVGRGTRSRRQPEGEEEGPSADRDVKAVRVTVTVTL